MLRRTYGFGSNFGNNSWKGSAAVSGYVSIAPKLCCTGLSAVVFCGNLLKISLERIAEEAYLASKGQCLAVGLIVLREAIYIRQEMGRPVGGRKRPNGRW